MNQRNQWINRAIIVLVLLGLGVWGWRRWQAPAEPAAPGPVMRPFNGGPVQVRIDDKLSPEDRRAALAQMGAPMERMTEEFFGLAPEEQRMYLDRQIDQMQKLERDLKAGRTPLPQGPGSGEMQLAFSPADHLESTTPEQRAREQEYFRRLRERKKERGIDDDGSMLFVVP